MIVSNLKSFIYCGSFKLTRDVSCNVFRNSVLPKRFQSSTFQKSLTTNFSTGKCQAREVLKLRNNYILKRLTSTGIKPEQKLKKGPVTWKTLFITLGIGGAFVAYFLYLKNEKMELREKERKRALGKARIGGKFELIDQNKRTVTSDDLLGNWLLIYFGFTHCPDICPDELEKMVQIVDTIDKDDKMKKVKPIFISVDPDRDTPEVVGKYVREFSDKILGLTGTTDQVAAACKAYRVYFSAGPKDSDSDYIVDHTIIMYLVDPDGNFVDYYGQNKNTEQIVFGIQFNQAKYDKNKYSGWTGRFVNNLFG